MSLPAREFADKLIPEDRMSLPAREFAERVLRRNCQRLLDRHD